MGTVVQLNRVMTDDEYAALTRVSAGMGRIIDGIQDPRTQATLRERKRLMDVRIEHYRKQAERVGGGL